MDRSAWLEEKRRLAEGGYHYYPPIRWVLERAREAALVPLEEAEGDGLHHLLARRS